MLKNVLSLLLSRFYSKKESALVASLALPDKSVSTSVSVTGGRNEYVAPNDGYLEFVTTVPNNGINLYGQVLQTSNYPREGRAAKLFVPIAKGKKIIFEVAADTSVMFYALVGGGYKALKNALLQGGGLCLKHLYSSLRRNSCRVRERGFNTQSVHQSRRSTSLSLKTMCGTLLRPVRTVTLRSQETPRVSFWKFPQAAQGLLIAKYFRGDTSFLSQKVSHSHTWCHLIQLLTRFSLSQCGLKTNSAVGGASC